MRAVCAGVLFVSAVFAQTPEELNFTAAIGELREISRALPKYFIAEAKTHLATRRRIDSIAALNARRDQVRRQILQNVGGLPERTPLNAKVVGVLERDQYRIEKVIFESQPGLYVTANLYLPKNGKPPYPAVLFPLGHESGAKAHEAWQYVLGSLASKGFVTLAWDPIGQGERSQFYDPDLRRSRLVASTREHTMLGAQCLLVGDNIARYTIHDGIRALDYLVSRKEVDPNRVGVTGNSGGGTHTAYLAALDDRLKVAAPSCYITSWDRLMTQLGPQDAEQNLPPWLNVGFDFPDFIYAFGGKPYLVLSAIRDFFPIGGARASVAEARRTYDSLGISEKLGMVEADDGHGYTLPRRLAAYQWMSKWLKGEDDDGKEPPVLLASEAELQCTSTGQISTAFPGESVFTLNRKRADQLRAKSPGKQDVLAAARELSGYRPQPGPLPVTHYGTLRANGYRVEKLVYESEPGILIPAVLAIPAQQGSSHDAVVYVDGHGKAAVASKLAKWMKNGTVVLAIDARGFGETQSKSEAAREDNRNWFGDASSTSSAFLLGKTLVGLRALDIIKGFELLSERTDLSLTNMRVIGIEAASVPALFAAALDSRIQSVELDGMLMSYRSVIETPIHRHAYEQVIPGVIRKFDLPDLVAALSPRPVRITSLVDAMGDPVPAKIAASLYGAHMVNN
jgi:cephalosporin-C deacetylase-like acetyl esterase